MRSEGYSSCHVCVSVCVRWSGAVGYSSCRVCVCVCEMVRGCGGEMLTHIVDVFSTVWREERVPAEWRDAILVSIPKKRDLSKCDSWREISLLDTMGKLFTEVIQVRLQKVAGEVLPDSQCGFCRDKVCVDVIYFTRQLMQKTKEHNTLFMLFVDLRKAYDSVPRQAPWLVLQKYGIPPTLVNLIKSLHEGLTAGYSGWSYLPRDQGHQWPATGLYYRPSPL